VACMRVGGAADVHVGAAGARVCTSRRASRRRRPGPPTHWSTHTRPTARTQPVQRLALSCRASPNRARTLTLASRRVRPSSLTTGMTLKGTWMPSLAR
jgi:hypothetical protein